MADSQFKTIKSNEIEPLLMENRKNILHNGDFNVNTRGQSNYTGAGFGLDRWSASNSGYTITVGTGNITIACSTVTGGFYSQRIMQDITGKTVTISVELADGTILSKTFANVAQTSVNQQIVTNVYLRISYGSGYYIGFLFNAATSISIKRIKCEVGNIATLAYDPPSDYGEQLQLCHRFALGPLNGNIRATAVTGNALTFFIPTPAPLRINPTLASGSVTVNTLALAAQTGFTFTYTARPNGISVSAAKTTHGLSDATLVLADAIFSAEI